MGVSGVVLLGSPRSGTTLLRRILGAHSDIASPGETGLLRGAANFLSSETTGVGVELGAKAGLAHMGVSEEVTYKRLRDFVFSFMDEYAEKEGKPIWLEKDAFNGFHVDDIQKICGDEIKYICIVRHGLDVALSVEEFCQKSGSHVLNFHDYIKKHQQPLLAYTHAWVDINQSIMRLCAERPAQTLLVRYEDLVDKPSETVDSILEYLSVESSPDLVEHALNTKGAIGLSDWKAFSKNSIDRGSIDRWKSCHPYALSQMAKVANATLTKFGYKEVVSAWDDSPQLAQRRYELALALNSAKSKL
ncbi:hypothetical protein SIN8267_02402 [Sinobacterium norvegicum]|uniref:Sulfotransferase n=1 Tax=Sinobacterium norvegicum TaxID=1641715 RepID=A0ABN8EII9_9GAMM|nr:sulfotransferase [Sinobacterium norvegicum]CAH0992283.1 hypothetical protein SIN8267_02402 [Sinobacterium norvegicum]